MILPFLLGLAACVEHPRPVDRELADEACVAACETRSAIDCPSDSPWLALTCADQCAARSLPTGCVPSDFQLRDCEASAAWSCGPAGPTLGAQCAAEHAQLANCLLEE